MSGSDRRLVVITGVTRGLGFELSRGMAARGHQVVGCGRSGPTVDAMNSEAHDGEAFAVVDVRSDQQIRAWAERVLERFGTPDLLINNAAVINANAPLWEVPTAEFDMVIDVNLKGIANVIRAFVPAMVARGRGVIVNLSSGWGRPTSAEVAPYCATKWGVEGLTRALAQELPAGMGAIPLNPGIIDTDMLRSCFGAQSQAYPSAKEWARGAVPYILALSASHNGKPLTVS